MITFIPHDHASCDAAVRAFRLPTSQAWAAIRCKRTIKCRLDQFGLYTALGGGARDVHLVAPAPEHLILDVSHQP